MCKSFHQSFRIEKAIQTDNKFEGLAKVRLQISSATTDQYASEKRR